VYKLKELNIVHIKILYIEVVHKDSEEIHGGV
jgi:hypothetical protein